jgi:hypothetical protein
MGSIVRNCYNQNTSAFPSGSYFTFQSENLANAATVISSVGYDIDFLPVSGVFQLNALNGDTVAYMGNGNLVNFAMAPTAGSLTNSVAAKQAAAATTTVLQGGDVFCVYLGSGNGHAWMQVINVGSPTVGPTFEFRLNTTLPYYAYQQTNADLTGTCATAVQTSTNTATNTITSTSTNTPLFTYTFTTTFTQTPTYTVTNTPTLTDTSTATSSPTNTATSTFTNTATNTFTSTNTPTVTDTPLINNGVVTTLAGTGTAGSANGAGTSSTFNAPAGLAVDNFSDVYVADYSNDLIREISSSGTVSTFAGQAGVQGAANGSSTSSTFYLPTGVAANSAGTTIYVADYSNDLIREITGGIVTTLAGTGSAGSANGTGTAASFTNPFGVAVDSSGNVYVADTNNSLIRKITAGVVTTLAGSGTQGSANGIGTAAQFTLPRGIAVDSSGNVYVADTGNNMIREISPGGVVTTLAGQTTAGSTNATGTAASFSSPYAIAVDSSAFLYVADFGNNMIRKITPGGVVTTLAGQLTAGSANATGTAASFNGPQGIAVDANGHVYVGDSNNNLIRVIQ